MNKVRDSCLNGVSINLSWIDILTGLLPSLKSTGREIDAYRDEVLEEHYKIVKFGDDEHLNKKDFVDILQKDGMHGYELRHGNLKAILLNMLIGGGDSTSTTLKWPNFEVKNERERRRANPIASTKKNLTSPVTDIVKPGYEMVIPNEGMPISKEPSKRGNLIIKFDVIYPSRLSSEQKSDLRRALGGSES
ncbi:hypothetical protein CMV_019268 [Castanea mollissima]|uniref:Chaperone DnaJ C-terminal domain-containing protein n=1 Tax=Castanea mollissima TaxID=60419 RepID=A0A8J4QZ40_9ROSI|nr:hypothetical protein CMV_019268 [Castanea mollissima]